MKHPKGCCELPLMWFRWPSDTLKRCYSLCQHMMHFFHQYLLYVTFEVLEPLWHTMSIQCRAANTLDEVSLSRSALPCPAQSCLALPCSVLPCSALPCPALPCPTSPNPPHPDLTLFWMESATLGLPGLLHPLITHQCGGPCVPGL